ncbi:MAG: tetratricopeptide repeat protein [Melioribacteraceae bacterium]|nr:tetratricopeptide repeat protein [Melioribacteraceae bacterium]
MNRYLHYILLITILAGNVFAQSPEEIFSEGNSAYQNEDWQSAIISYEKLLNQNYESAALYYNLGNAYFKPE